MGGKVLTLESERLISQGLAQGEILGAIKMCESFNLTIGEIIDKLVQNFCITKDEAMEKIAEYKKENQ